MIPGDHVAYGILAGGRGSRLGGADKALLEFEGRTLLERTLQALAAPPARTLVSHAAGNPRIAALGVITVPDLRPSQPGPLAGWEALMTICPMPWLLTVPVDLRHIPERLPERLRELARDDGAMLHDGDGGQWLVGLWRVASVLPRVRAALDAGQGAAQGVVAKLDVAVLDISPSVVGNLNTPADFLVQDKR